LRRTRREGRTGMGGSQRPWRWAAAADLGWRL